MSLLKRILVGLGGLLALCVLYLLFWPVQVDPAAWDPPAAPAREGVYAKNQRLGAAERLAMPGNGPEDVAVDAAGRIYGGLDDGRIVRMNPDGSGVETFADTGGRPLGLDFDAAGNLLVADSHKGLLRIAPDGAITVLTDSVDGKRFGFPDDVDVAPDGVIYFSDASSKWHFGQLREDILEHRPYGSLLAYDPTSGVTRVVLSGLYFANGVAVSPDNQFVLVNETTAYRVRRHWLRGPRAGQTDTIIDNLPGFPDGVSTGSHGRFWVALFSPRVALLDKLLPHPWLRKVIYRLPLFLQPDPARYAMILAITGDGKVVDNLQDGAADCYAPLTSIEEVGDKLYFGSLERPAVARMALPPPRSAQSSAGADRE